jgi:membrane protein DedA with SNARE-associated domain
MRRLVTLAVATPSLTGILDHYGALAVFAFVVVENFGLPIPGETMLVFASAYAARGHLNIVLVVAASIAGVWLGSTLSYLAGRRGGVALLRRLHVPDRHLDRAQLYMVRWGGYTVFLGRYVAFLRSYIGWLAGINRMAQAPFLLWNLAGATAWTLTFATLGYLVGNNWAMIEKIFKTLGYGGAAIVAVAFVAYLVYRRRREARADVPAHAEVEEQAGAEESGEQLTGPGVQR